MTSNGPETPEMTSNGPETPEMTSNGPETPEMTSNGTDGLIMPAAGRSPIGHGPGNDHVSCKKCAYTQYGQEQDCQEYVYMYVLLAGGIVPVLLLPGHGYAVPGHDRNPGHGSALIGQMLATT